MVSVGKNVQGGVKRLMIGGLWVRPVVSYLVPGSGMTRAGSLVRKKKNSHRKKR